MPRHRRIPAEKGKKMVIKACERTDKLETRKNYCHPRQSREMSHKGTRHSKEVDRVLLRIEYTQQQKQEIPRRKMSLHPILWVEAEAAVKSLKKSESVRVDHIPSELVQASGETMTDMLLIICSKIWRTGSEASTLDSASDHHSPEERQPATMPKLPYHQPHQSSK